MSPIKKDPVFSMLRVLSSIISAALVAVLFFIALLGISSLYNDEITVFQARANFSNFETDSFPAYLNGTWEKYDGVYMAPEEYNPALLKNPKYETLPLGSISAAKGTATWKMNIHLPTVEEALYIYIPTQRTPVNIFVDGVPLTQMEKQENRLSLFTFAMHAIPVSRTEKGEHEIVISTNKNPEDTALYQRQVIVGTLGQIIYLASDSMITSMFLFGVILLLLISGYMFMVLRPEHVIISFITLFDSLLMARIICGYNDIFFFLRSIYPFFSITDSQAFTLQILFLMLAGVTGTRLANRLFDPENRIPKVVTLGLTCCYALMAIIFPFNIPLFEQYGFYALVACYLLTFMVMPFQMLVYLKKHHGGYSYFQLVKTVFIGVVLFFDITLMNTKTDIFLYTNLYLIFFLAHLFIRLYDNNKSYEAVEILNQDLEQKVADRTAELVQTNKVLAELSVRDPLTNAYNRLYCEQLIEHSIKSYVNGRDSLHLAIFDLDHFKNINDKYGHHEGDLQLRFVVSVVNKIIGNNTTLARVGGEEFILLFRESATREVLACLESIRATLENEAKINPKRTTASFGVVKFRPGLSQKTLFILADRCLYQAKNTGRNKTVFQSPAADIDGSPLPLAPIIARPETR